jgi:hypothetical protein
LNPALVSSIRRALGLLAKTSSGSFPQPNVTTPHFDSTDIVLLSADAVFSVP